MGPLLVDLLTAALVAAALYSRLPVVLGVLIGTVLLIPATLVTPHLHSSYALLNHLVIAAAALRLALMVRSGALPRARFQATPVHLAAGAFLVTGVAAGVVFAPETGQPAVAAQRVIGIAFAIIFFVVILALLRELDQPWLFVQLVVASLAIACGIAIIEHITGDSFGHWLFALAGHPGPVTAAHVLETRAGHFRVRASGEFALAFAWVAVMALPLATVWAFRTRRAVVLGLPLLLLVTAAIYWTYSRSAAAAIPFIVLLLAITVRDRRTALLAAGTTVAVVALFALDSAIRHHLSLTTDQGSVGIRYQRLPVILNDVAPHSYLGLGYGGLMPKGFPTTDNFYLASYAETGVIGATMLVAMCTTAVLQSLRGLRATDSLRRAICAASAVGFIGFLVSGLFDDALLLAQPAELAFLLLAAATATSEPEFGFAAMPRWSTNRIVFMTAVGAAVGLAGFALAPRTVSQERTFSTISPLRMTTPGDGEVTAPSLIDTICQIATAVQPTMPKVHISCRDNFTVTGEGTLRVEAPSATATIDTYNALAHAAHQVFYLTSYETLPTGPPIKARQTFWQTAPASGAVLGFAIAFIAPLPLRRRQRLHL